MKPMLRELQRIDQLRSAFEKIHEEFPLGGYDKTLADLDRERAELVNKIGKKNENRSNK